MTYVMKMPASYVDVSKKEMEYDGGIAPALAWSFACLGISCALTAIGTFGVKAMVNAGWIDKDTANWLSLGLTVAGGIFGAASGAGLLLKFGINVPGVILMEGGRYLGAAGAAHTAATWSN